MMSNLFQSIRWSFLTFLLILGSCVSPGSDAGSAPGLGELRLNLQTADHIYQLSGSASFTRQGAPAFSRSVVLDGTEQHETLLLPIGTYEGHLEDGFSLSRIDGSAAIDLTSRVISHQLAPNPAQITEGGSTTVTITLTLDDESLVVFGAGEVLVVLSVVTDGLECGGCADGQVCLERASRNFECATVCDPEFGLTPRCEAGLACLARDFTFDAAGELQPVFTCQPPSGGEGEDVTPPVLTGLSLSTSSIDTSSADATLTATITATDELSGVVHAQLQFSSASGQTRYCVASVVSAPETAVNFSCDATFTAFGEGGTWLIHARVIDAVGNPLFLDNNALAALGFPGTLEVTSDQDVTPPILTGLSLSTPSIDTSSADATLSATITATDALSGVVHAQLQFSSASGQTRYCVASVVSAPESAVNFSCDATFTAFGEGGTWLIHARVIDAVGNPLFLDNNALAALGFPGTLQVN